MAEMLPIQRTAKTHLSIDHKAINHISNSEGDHLLTLTRVFCWVFVFVFFFRVLRATLECFTMEMSPLPMNYYNL